MCRYLPYNNLPFNEAYISHILTYTKFKHVTSKYY